MLRIIYGTAGAGKTGFVINEIRDFVLNKRPGTIFIVPEQYSHEAERELCRVCGDRFSMYGEVFSFSRLATRVEEEVGTSGIAYLDKGGRLLTMALALEAVQPHLSIYGGIRNRSRLTKELLAAVDEIKSSVLTADMLIKAGEDSCGTLSKKLTDVALVLESYDAIAAQGKADPTDKLNRLAKLIKESSVGDIGRIYIDGFVDFTGQELNVIDALLQKRADITVCLNCDSLTGGLEIFQMSRRTAAWLLRRAKELGVECESRLHENKDRGTAPMGFISEHLFSYTDKLYDAGDAVNLYYASGITDECSMAAAQVLKLVRETGCRYRDIAVAVRGFEDYGKILENIFSYYNIPIYISQKSSLISHSAPGLISAVIEIIQGGWEYEAVLGYLKTGLSSCTIEQCDLLDNYIYLWSIRGHRLWTRPEDWTMHPQGYGRPVTDETGGILAQINGIRRSVALPIDRLIKAGKSGETAVEQAMALAGFLMEIQLPERLQERAQKLQDTGRMTLAMEYSQIWDITVSALEQSAAVLGDMPMSQGEYFDYFKELLSAYDIGSIPISLDSVIAGDMDRVRRRNIKHLIVLGASDDRLPRIREDSGIFTAQEREEISRLGLNLGEGGQEQIYRELNIIYNCMSLPSDSLTVSYGDTGEDAIPSYIYTRIRGLVKKEPAAVDMDEIKSSSYLPALELTARAIGEKTPLACAVYDYVQAVHGSSVTEKLIRVSEQKRGVLSESAVEQLYGAKPGLSASRVDVLSSCRFRYFMKYGLSARHRRPAGFSPPEMGLFMHRVLEGVFRDISQGPGFKYVTGRQVMDYTQVHVERYVREEMDGMREKSSRFIYLFNRLIKTVYTVVQDMAEELRDSEFRPIDFELSFSSGGDLPPVQLGEGKISGIVDRVDGWVHEDKLYIRVVDYKTGTKKFSLSDVWYGMGLQMLMYLFSLQQHGDLRYNREIIPAGVMYIPARDVLISAPSDLSDEEIAKQRGTKLARSGLLLNDKAVLEAMEPVPKYLPVKFGKDGEPKGDSLAAAQRMGAMARHIERTLKKLYAALKGGCIDADPVYRGPEDTACTFCEYSQACHFDESRDRRRYLPKQKAEDVWQKIEAEDRRQGNE